ncbi:hypothetical protein ACEPAF_9775 [Sanghuangporus sanghuang]|uniref:Uncharacterized protein n=1 Tax=Sanghuangporus baumii TaxID=108892 RepID=A0A9Q5NAI8_SANBA|nr:hypothetical protein A7U60_g2910 [Sanghuangporus baumii]
MRRIETDGSRLLNWFPGVLRYLLHARIVGSVAAAPEESYFGPAVRDTTLQQRAVLRVLVMLEVLDWGESVLEEAESKTPNRTLSESVRKRILQGELIRILVSSEDLKEELEQELEDLRDRRERRKRNCLSLSPIETPGLRATTTYAHPLLDRGISATGARHSARPDLSWMQTTLAPSVLTHSRQRAHSFPLALGLLARSVIMGTITPSRLRTRARSLGDELSLD